MTARTHGQRLGWQAQQAARRRQHNRASPTNDGLERDADEQGLAGQLAFCQWAGLPESAITSTSRTKGYQFEVNGVKVRTHTSATPGYLLEKAGRLAADVYLLCHYTARKDAVLLGWATRDDLAAQPIRTYAAPGAKYQLPAHGIPRSGLRRDWEALRALLGLAVKQLALFGAEAAPEAHRRLWDAD